MRESVRVTVVGLLAAILSVVMLTSTTGPAWATSGWTSTPCKSSGYSCVSGGYQATAATTGNSWAWRRYGEVGANGIQTTTGPHNCTLYAAWRLQANGMGDPGTKWGDAAQWGSSLGYDQNAVPGSIAWWSSNHVAYVEEVSGDQVRVSADNFVGDGNYKAKGQATSGAAGYTDSGWVSKSAPTGYLHPYRAGEGSSTSPVVAKYMGHVVKRKAENPPVTSWLVGPDGRRTWIPDGGTYNWLLAAGAGGPDLLTDEELRALPDLTNVPARTNQIGVDWWVPRNTTVWSTKNGYALIFQSDSNLVVYAPGGRAVWASRTTGSGADRVTMQRDGNLVIYRGNTAVWASGTAGKGASRLVMQDDGNVVIYRGAPGGWDGSPTWTTGTSGGANQLASPAGFRL